MRVIVPACPYCGSYMREIPEKLAGWLYCDCSYARETHGDGGFKRQTLGQLDREAQSPEQCRLNKDRPRNRR